MSVTVLQGNVSFDSVGIREVHRLTVFQYRYIGELQHYCTVRKYLTTIGAAHVISVVLVDGTFYLITA